MMLLDFLCMICEENERKTKRHQQIQDHTHFCMCCVLSTSLSHRLDERLLCPFSNTLSLCFMYAFSFPLCVSRCYRFCIGKDGVQEVVEEVETLEAQASAKSGKLVSVRYDMNYYNNLRFERAGGFYMKTKHDPESKTPLLNFVQIVDEGVWTALVVLNTNIKFDKYENESCV